MTFCEETISSELIYEGQILNLRRHKVVTVSGRESHREIVEHRGAVAMAAITGQGRMILVRQFRKALEQDLLEIPAGKIEKGEDPLETAIRELKEETGYTAGRVQPLIKIYPAVGYSNEVIHIYLCRDLVPGDTEFDDSEAIDVEEYTMDSLYEMVMSGQIPDGKTMAAILAVRLQLEREALL